MFLNFFIILIDKFIIKKIISFYDIINYFYVLNDLEETFFEKSSFSTASYSTSTSIQLKSFQRAFPVFSIKKVALYSKFPLLSLEATFGKKQFGFNSAAYES